MKSWNITRDELPEVAYISRVKIKLICVKIQYANGNEKEYQCEEPMQVGNMSEAYPRLLQLLIANKVIDWNELRQILLDNSLGMRKDDVPPNRSSSSYKDLNIGFFKDKTRALGLENTLFLNEDNGILDKFKAIQKIALEIKRVHDEFEIIMCYDIDEASQSNEKFDVNHGEGFMNIKDTLEETLKTSKQVILTGAPGTGKTYKVRQFVKTQTGNDENRFKFIQFHSSYDYTDFVEGLRPVPISAGSKETAFVRMDGTFKAFCREIVDATLRMIEKQFEEDGNRGIADKEMILDAWYALMVARDDQGNDDLAKATEIYREKNDRTNIPSGLFDGVKNGLARAEEIKYYFVIDEINRADLSRVFGELMFGLEESYRGIANRFDTQYKNLRTYQMNGRTADVMPFDCFEKGFFIPKNLYIIGTMNDIDRSVEAFDFALRRRFRWIEVKANDVMEPAFDEMKITLSVELVQKMNDALHADRKYGLNEAYHIGPAYFKDYKAEEDGTNNLETIWKNKVAPIIREYTRGNRDGKELLEKCRKFLFGEQTEG